MGRSGQAQQSPARKPIAHTAFCRCTLHVPGFIWSFAERVASCEQQSSHPSMLSPCHAGSLGRARIQAGAQSQRLYTAVSACAAAPSIGRKGERGETQLAVLRLPQGAARTVRQALLHLEPFVTDSAFIWMEKSRRIHPLDVLTSLTCATYDVRNSLTFPALLWTRLAGLAQPVASHLSFASALAVRPQGTTSRAGVTGPSAARRGMAAAASAAAASATAAEIDVEMVVDPMCPWCYIGLKRLQGAVEAATAEGIAVSVRFTPYVFDPDTPVPHLGWRDYVALKYPDRRATAELREMPANRANRANRPRSSCAFESLAPGRADVLLTV